MKTGDGMEFLLQYARFPVASLCHVILICYADFDLGKHPHAVCGELQTAVVLLQEALFHSAF